MGGRHYLPLTEEQRQDMLHELGINSVEELFSDIPADVRLKKALNLFPPFTEIEVLRHLEGLADKNKNMRKYACFLGAGVYDHFIPTVVKHITSRSEFYTSYTPYQAEISQGMLQAIFEYQTLICELTGMEVTNASLYDGATALAEAAIMACTTTRRQRILLSRSVNPFYRYVLKRYFAGRNLCCSEIPLKEGKTDLEQAEAALNADDAALVVQTPNFFGIVENLQGVADFLHAKGSLLIAVADPISLPVLKTPGEYGADIVVGEGQGLGNPPSFGGPLLGFLAAKEKFTRRMPGRIVGETTDVHGKRGFVLTLQTREQHIRRERPTSNICSNEALNVLAAAVYMVALGRVGLQEVATLCLQKAAYAREKIAGLPGFEPVFPGYHFKEFAVRLPGKAAELNRELLEREIIGGLDLGVYYPELNNCMLFCFTENRTCAEIDRLVQGLEAWK